MLDPLAPIVGNRPARDVGSTLKVVLFNGRGCGATAGIMEHLRRPPLSGADIVLLSEVDWALPRSGYRQCAADLAAHLSMSFAYGPEFGFAREQAEFKSFFGNAILAVAPLAAVELVPLTMLYDWTRRRLPGNPPGLIRVGRRSGIVANISIKGQPISLGVVHLENRVGPESRELQMKEFLSALPPAGPAIIGGDLNTTTMNLRSGWQYLSVLRRFSVDPRRLRRPQPYEPLFDVLDRSGFEYRDANPALAPTYTPAWWVPKFLRPKLDWIAVRELKPIADSARVVSARCAITRRLSDHDFVVCEIAI